MARRLSMLVVLAMVAATLSAEEIDVSTLRTFGTMGKQVRVLKGRKEVELFTHQGKGCLTHM